LTNDIPKHGARYNFVSGLYHGDTLAFQAVDLGDTVGLTIEVTEDGGPVTSCGATLTLEQLAEFSNAMYAALGQASQIAEAQNTRRLLSLIRSGIAENPLKGKDGA
jgi:hypothetical protein